MKGLAEKVKIDVFTESLVIEKISHYLVPVGTGYVGEETQSILSDFLHEVVTKPGIVGFHATAFKNEWRIKSLTEYFYSSGVENPKPIVEYMIFKSAFVSCFIDFLKRDDIYRNSVQSIINENFLLSEHVRNTNLGSLYTVDMNYDLYVSISHGFSMLMSFLDDQIILKDE